MTKGDTEVRTPGQYRQQTLPSGKVVKLGKAFEQIHHSVQFRIKNVQDTTQTL